MGALPLGNLFTAATGTGETAESDACAVFTTGETATGAAAAAASARRDLRATATGGRERLVPTAASERDGRPRLVGRSLAAAAAAGAIKTIFCGEQQAAAGPALSRVSLSRSTRSVRSAVADAAPSTQARRIARSRSSDEEPRLLS